MTDNLFHGIPPEFENEIFDKLVEREGVRIERIVSDGHASPDGFWYDQDEHEFVLVVQGSAVIEFDDARRVEMSAGDWLEIPARQMHRVVRTSDSVQTIWLAVFWK